MRRSAIASCCLTVLLAAGSSVAQSTTRVSVSTAGAQGDASSGDPVITPDGKFVCFYSSATTLVPGDTNLVRDVFVRDLTSGVTTRVSLSSTGAQGDGASASPTISADGRFAAFHSDATNLVAGDTNLMRDVFVRDRLTGTTTRVSVSTAGVQGNGLSSVPSISDDGRYVVFESGADNLVPGDSNLVNDVFVRDTLLNTTTRISVNTAGVQGNALSGGGRISGDGRWIAFYSDASNLVPGDTNLLRDVFLRDTQTNTTTRVSLSTAGAQGDALSTSPEISADGRYVVFNSDATNLVAGDTNLVTDAFRRDTLTNTTTRISVATSGAQGNAKSSDPSLSATGRFVAFYSDATNLVTGDTNAVRDVFLRDMQTGFTRRVSVSTAGGQGDGLSSLGEHHLVTADGRFVVFYSDATNLVPGDTNLVRDSFLRDTSPWTDLGGALSGVNLDPLLVGTGTWEPTDLNALTLTNAAPGAAAAMFISFSSVPVALKGGVLQANPFLLQVTLVTDGSGSIPLPFVTPTGLPAGTTLYFQYLIQDAVAIHGVSFSNAVRAVTP